MQTLTTTRSFVINFRIDGRPQQWIRFGKDIASVRDSAREAIRNEWPAAKLSNLRVAAGA